MITTGIKEIRIGTLSTLTQVLEVLQWNDLEYGQFQEAMGYAYLASEFEDDVLFVKELPYTAEFWAWWKNHWQKRDVLFLLAANDLGLSDRITLYKQFHSVDDFYFRPHRRILEKSYALMIDKVIKEAVK